MTAPAACPGCGAEVADAVSFCPACGRQLRAAPAAPPRPRHKKVRRPVRTSRTLWRQMLPALQLWLTLLVILGGTGLLQHLFDLTSLWFEVAWTAVAAVVVVAFCLKDRPAIAVLLRRPGFDERTWWHPLVAIAGMMLFLEGYFRILAALGVDSLPMLESYRQQGWPLAAAFLLISICPAVFEELAFRGFILGRLDQVMGPREAVVVQAAMFSVIHLAPLIFLSHFATGLVLGILRRTTDSLYPCMAVHALWNAWVLLVEI